ncbi:MAG: methyltransferase [Bacteroidota bacterium]|nr:methyltransferase [Bacteroidota bacterium]
MNHQKDFISLFNKSLEENTFVKVSLANYNGLTEGLKNCYIKKTRIQNEDKLSFTFRYQTKDIVKNYSIKEGLSLADEWLEKKEFRHASLFTLEFDAVLEYSIDKTTLKKNKATHYELPSLEHNIKKNRLIAAEGKPYLKWLKITDEKGNVFNHAQDKYKQINHYVEVLSPLIKNLPKHDVLHVLDMGAGKGYLTFALYDYLADVLNLKTEVNGVEYRKDLVDICNDIAVKSKFEGLSFVQGTIMDYDVKQVNVLIALHACDTATDDAIYKGILSGAELIVVAPCCHKQIRRELEQSKAKNELDFLLKHGIYLEREAEMVTDGLRSLLLEYAGYTTRVFEFISGEHTPKNVMIVAEKKSKTEAQKKELLVKINETKAYFGIRNHHLEKLMGL